MYSRGMSWLGALIIGASAIVCALVWVAVAFEQMKGQGE